MTKFSYFMRYTSQGYLRGVHGEMQDYSTDWMWTYNKERTNMALGGMAPKQKLALTITPTSDYHQKLGNYHARIHSPPRGRRQALESNEPIVITVRHQVAARAGAA